MGHRNSCTAKEEILVSESSLQPGCVMSTVQTFAFKFQPIANGKKDEKSRSCRVETEHFSMFDAPFSLHELTSVSDRREEK